MSDPKYRQRLQRVADLLIATVPSAWQDATVRVRFTSRVSTSFEVSYRALPDGPENSSEVPNAMMRDFVRAARDVREELIRAGNPECQGFVFRLSRDGKSSIDVDY